MKKPIYTTECDHFQISENKSFEKVCYTSTTGYKYKNKIVGWENVDRIDVTAGKEEIYALVTDVYSGDIMDGIPTIAGKDVDRWA